MEAGMLPLLLPSLADVPSLHVPFTSSPTRTSLPQATGGFAFYSAASLGNWKSITPLRWREEGPSPSSSKTGDVSKGTKGTQYRGAGEVTDAQCGTQDGKMNTKLAIIITNSSGTALFAVTR